MLAASSDLYIQDMLGKELDKLLASILILFYCVYIHVCMSWIEIEYVLTKFRNFCSLRLYKTCLQEMALYNTFNMCSTNINTSKKALSCKKYATWIVNLYLCVGSWLLLSLATFSKLWHPTPVNFVIPLSTIYHMTSHLWEVECHAIKSINH